MFQNLRKYYTICDYLKIEINVVYCSIRDMRVNIFFNYSLSVLNLKQKKNAKLQF